MERLTAYATDAERERMLWLRVMIAEETRKRPASMYSTQALLLLQDIEKAFCAGAWLSVIILAYAVIDATLRDVTTGDYKSKAADLYGEDPELEWLRSIRNQNRPCSTTRIPVDVMEATAYGFGGLSRSARV